MWVLTVRSPNSEPKEYTVPVGTTTIGRRVGNDIIIADESASRLHAQIDFSSERDVPVLADMGSTNGTFVNHERLEEPRPLRSNDQIRIGQHLIRVVLRDGLDPALLSPLAETQPITRDMLLEALDQHAVLLCEVSERLNTVVDLHKALDEVSAIMRVAMGADRCQVILADQFGQLAELGFPTAIAAEAIEQRSVLAIPDVARSDLALSQSTRLLGIRSVMCVPVIVDDDVAALVYVYKTQHSDRLLSQQDVQLAVAISHQAALTIQRARLLENAEMLRQLAMTDSLTGLYNRRHFFELGEHEVQRARRFRRPLSAIMVDIDHFKQVNDRFGHAAGDLIVRAVAGRCRFSLREADILGRYGGDEFALLVLENDLRSAAAIAERLRERVAARPVETDQGRVPVTISLGVASLSEAYPNLMQLLNAADSALYAAKNAGRNRVEVVGTESE